MSEKLKIWELIIMVVWTLLAIITCGLCAYGTAKTVKWDLIVADSADQNDTEVVEEHSESLHSRFSDSETVVFEPTLEIDPESYRSEELDGYEPDLERKETFVLEHVRITHYCPCELCCGPNAMGITASGTRATEGRTVGVDPSIIPYGSRVTIGGKNYIAEDTGGSGEYVDIFVNDHAEAIKLGMYYADVEVELP